MEPLTEVLKTGDKYVHVFEDANGKLFEVEITEQEYVQLGQPNPEFPTIKDCRWDHSEKRDRVSTPSGNIEPGTFQRIADGKIEAKGADGTYYNVPDTALVDGKLDVANLPSDATVIPPTI